MLLLLDEIQRNLSRNLWAALCQNTIHHKIDNGILILFLWELGAWSSCEFCWIVDHKMIPTTILIITVTVKITEATSKTCKCYKIVWLWWQAPILWSFTEVKQWREDLTIWIQHARDIQIFLCNLECCVQVLQWIILQIIIIIPVEYWCSKHKYLTFKHRSDGFFPNWTQQHEGVDNQPLVILSFSRVNLTSRVLSDLISLSMASCYFWWRNV